MIIRQLSVCGGIVFKCSSTHSVDRQVAPDDEHSTTNRNPVSTAKIHTSCDPQEFASYTAGRNVRDDRDAARRGRRGCIADDQASGQETSTAACEETATVSRGRQTD